PEAGLEAMPMAQRFQPDPRPGPEALCFAREQRERLQQLLHRLSPPLRGAVELHDLAGNSVPAAAHAMGVTPATFKCRLFRARRRLHAMARYA
ncbi:MAG: RNA polymerase sigma factor, partial [Terriglobales bacterium]